MCNLWIDHIAIKGLDVIIKPTDLEQFNSPKNVYTSTEKAGDRIRLQISISSQSGMHSLYQLHNYLGLKPF